MPFGVAVVTADAAEEEEADAFEKGEEVDATGSVVVAFDVAAD